MPRLWWALTQDELPHPRWRALQKYKILYTLFSVCPVWWDALIDWSMPSMRGWSHRPVLTTSGGISGYSSVKLGGLSSISQHNPQQCHGWNRTIFFDVIGAWVGEHFDRIELESHRLVSILAWLWIIGCSGREKERNMYAPMVWPVDDYKAWASSDDWNGQPTRSCFPGTYSIPTNSV